MSEYGPRRPEGARMMSIPKTLDELRRFYVEHRLQHLPGGGAYMTVIQQDAFIDVHEVPRAEFDQIIAAELAAAERRGAIRALREAAGSVSQMYGGGNAVAVFLEERAEREEAEQ